MKNFIRLFFAAFACALACACAPSSELRDGASFEGLTKYYINAPQGGDYSFRLWGGRTGFDSMMLKDIETILKERGFERVANKDEAQFCLTPMYSEWSFNYGNPAQVSPNNSVIGQIGNDTQGEYLNLEIQAYLPQFKDLAWRGFSNVKITRETMSSEQMKNQVIWCLEDFPPMQKKAATQTGVK